MKLHIFTFNYVEGRFEKKYKVTQYVVVANDRDEAAKIIPDKSVYNETLSFVDYSGPIQRPFVILETTYDRV